MRKRKSLNDSHFKFTPNQWKRFTSKKLDVESPHFFYHIKSSILRKLCEYSSLKELKKIYFPLLNLLDKLYAKHSLGKKNFKDLQHHTGQVLTAPYIISIAGSAAVGKSTISYLLKNLLNQCFQNCHIETITTDSFLYSNTILNKRGLTDKKGFPLSYDISNLFKFLFKIKSGVPSIVTPVYSHLYYDIIPDETRIINQPDILIIEGLNVLQENLKNLTSISDFVDFSIYVDASQKSLKRWYMYRFLNLRNIAFTNKNSYFFKYTKVSRKDATKIAMNLWNRINLLNLKKNISPTKNRANLILKKSVDHSIQSVYYCK